MIVRGLGSVITRQESVSVVNSEKEQIVPNQNVPDITNFVKRVTKMDVSNARVATVLIKQQSGESNVNRAGDLTHVVELVARKPVPHVWICCCCQSIGRGDAP